MIRTLKQARQALYGYIKRRGEPLQVSGLSEEMMEDVCLLQQVGFSSDLPVDTQVVMLPIGGRATNMVIVASGNAPITIKAGKGEAVIYDQFGHEIRLGKGGINLKGNVTIEGDLNTTGQVSDMTGTLTAIRQAYNLHQHSNDGASPPTVPMA